MSKKEQPNMFYTQQVIQTNIFMLTHGCSQNQEINTFAHNPQLPKLENMNKLFQGNKDSTTVKLRH